MATSSFRPKVALFVPCYVDQLYPGVAWAALELLERFGVDVEVPPQQTCCGQPLINTGAARAATPLLERFEQTFAAYEQVVCPSGSCCATLERELARRSGAPGPRLFELCEFLVEVVGVRRLDTPFPHRVLLHQSCHALRELGLGTASETGGGGESRHDPGRQLLELVPELSLVTPERSDECCGFGGSFCLIEPAVSSRMGQDRLEDFERAGAEIVTSLDMSCLMHLSGLSRRRGSPLAFMHIAEVLAGRPVSAPGAGEAGPA